MCTMIEAARSPQAALELFFSYAHEDARYRERLQRHLSTLRNEGLVADWHDGMLTPGAEWDVEIRARLARADIVVLLVSADFLASDYIARVELQEALRRDRARQSSVVPVVVQPCDWRSTDLGRLQALPRGAKPISRWRHPEEAYLDVAQGIRAAGEEILARRTKESGAIPGPKTALKRVAVAVVELTTVGDVDIERSQRALEHAAGALAKVIAEHDAAVDMSHLDELTAVFGVPHLADDDALRAVCAAADLHGRLPALNDELRQLFDVSIEARTAVDTGIAVVEDSGATAAAARTAAAGARRLLRATHDGEMLVGDAAYRLVKHAVRVDLVESSEPTPVRRLVSVLPGAPARPLRPRSETVGRSWEVAQLHTTFERTVTDRTCRLCVLVGPPGIGKTRLAHDLARYVAGRAVVLRGTCAESRATYWPLLEIVRQAAAIEPASAPEVVHAKIEALFEGEDEASLDAAAISGLLDLGEPSGDFEASGRAVRRLLEIVALQTPLVVVFDDVHLGKPAFLELVRYVAQQSYGSPLLLVCLAWPELDDEHRQWGEDLPNAARIRLEPLLADDAGQLIENLLDGGVEEGLRRRITEAVDGNPLFVEELVAMLVDLDLLELHEGVWRATGELPDDLFPSTVDLVVEARIDALPNAEHAVLNAGSIEGMRFHHEAVSALTRESLGGVVEPNLAALLRKDLVRHDRADFPGRASRFRHILIQKAAYESIPKLRRSEFHERFVEWMEAQIGERTAEHEETLAFHLERAHKLKEDVLGPQAPALRELAARASRLLFSVGRRAIARGEMADARALLERSRDLLGDEDENRAELLFDLAVAQMETGQLAKALATYDEAAAAARATGEVRIEWYARIHGSGLRADLDPGVGTRALTAEAAEAYHVFTELGDDLGIAKVWHRRGFVAAIDCHWRVAQAAFQRARRSARRAGADRDEAVACSMLFFCFVFGPEHAETAIRRSEKILAQTTFRGVGGVGLAALANLHAMRGAFEEARGLLEQSRTLLEDLGQLRRLNEALLFAAGAELLAGDVATATEHLQRARAATSAAKQVGLLSSIDAYLAQALLASGGYEEADHAALTSAQAAADEDLFTQLRWRPVRARVLALRGELASALALAKDAVERAATTDDLNAHASALADHAEVLRLAGRDDDARAAADDAIGLYRRKGNIIGENELRRRWAV